MVTKCVLCLLSPRYSDHVFMILFRCFNICLYLSLSLTLSPHRQLVSSSYEQWQIGRPFIYMSSSSAGKTMIGPLHARASYLLPHLIPFKAGAKVSQREPFSTSSPTNHREDQPWLCKVFQQKGSQNSHPS